MDRHELRWWRICAFSGVVIFLGLYTKAMLHDLRVRHGQMDWLTMTSGIFPVGIASLIATLFLIGIPWRIAMNILIKERRKRCWQETAVLILTYAALTWMFVALFHNPPEG